MPKLDLPFPPRKSRAHEVCGPAATSFAVMLAGVLDGPVLWLKQGHERGRLHPSALAEYADPARFLFGKGKTQTDVLWMAEEALRSGATPLVVAQLTERLDLTAGRRLQLAAEIGRSRGLFLIPEGAGSNAAETRWRCSSHFDGVDSTRQHWQLIKNKTGTLGDWIIRWDEQTRRVIVVSKTAERADSAPAPG